jgi:hypothetical protein
VSHREAQCSFCKRSVVFAETREGVALCVDAESADGGTVELMPGDYPDGPHLAVLYQRVEGKRSPRAGPLHTLHFLTCSEPRREW